MTTQQKANRPPAPTGPGIEVSEKLTHHFAAAAIAEPSFPGDAAMPRIDPVPHNNLGHMPLVDYPRLCEILWGCAAEIRAAHAEALRAYQPLAIPLALTTLAALCFVAFMGPEFIGLLTLPIFVYYLYLLLAEAQKVGTSPAFSWGPAIGSVVIVGVTQGVLDIVMKAVLTPIGHAQTRQVALAIVLAVTASLAVYAIIRDRCKTDALRAVKAKYIGALLADEPPEIRAERSACAINPLAKSSVGCGILRPDEVQVFVANGADDLLPGLGPVGVRELYVCPPKLDDEHEQAEACDLVALYKELEDNLATAAASLPARGLACSTAHGALAIIDAHSLRSDSPWLAEQRPFLRVKRSGDLDALLAMRSLDPEARARVFLGLQVYFPEYSTLVTLAARVFFASSSASVQVLVASLGPPRANRRSLRDHLNWQARQSLRRTMTAPRSSLAARLDTIAGLLATRADPLAVQPDRRALTALFERAEREKDEAYQATRLAETTHRWVGPHCHIPNWRQARSLAMADEFFDASECVASVRALFASVVESMLSSLDRRGFNVDAYRDARGKLTIKTESIDQMIIGDRIQITHGDQRKAPTEGGPGEAAAANATKVPAPAEPKAA